MRGKVEFSKLFEVGEEDVNNSGQATLSSVFKNQGSDHSVWKFFTLFFGKSFLRCRH